MFVPRQLRFRPDEGGGTPDAGGGAPEGESSSEVVTTTEGTATTFKAEVPFPDSNAAPADPDGEDKKPTEFNFDDIIPEEFKDKGYWADLKKHETPVKEMAKQYAHLQKKLGEKPTEIPKDDAPQEEWDAFYAKSGRPEKPDDYVYQRPELPAEYKELEGLFDNERQDAFVGEVKSLLHKAGVTKRQADILMPGYDSLVMKHRGEQLKETLAAEKALDDAFEAAVTKELGDKKDATLAAGKELLGKVPFEGLKERLQKKDPQDLADFAVVLGWLHSSYVREDNPAGGSPTATAEANKKRRTDIIGGRAGDDSEAYHNIMHPRHDEVVKLVNSLYGT